MHEIPHDKKMKPMERDDETILNILKSVRTKFLEAKILLELKNIHLFVSCTNRIYNAEALASIN